MIDGFARDARLKEGKSRERGIILDEEEHGFISWKEKAYWKARAHGVWAWSGRAVDIQTHRSVMKWLWWLAGNNRFATSRLDSSYFTWRSWKRTAERFTSNIWRLRDLVFWPSRASSHGILTWDDFSTWDIDLNIPDKSASSSNSQIRSFHFFAF